MTTLPSTGWPSTPTTLVNGYASQLYQAVINYFTSGFNDIKSVRVDTHEDNLPMQHLIEKSGFKRVGTCTGSTGGKRDQLRLRTSDCLNYAY